MSSLSCCYRLAGLELAVGSRLIGKRITLSRPRMESPGTALIARAGLCVRILVVGDPEDFLTGAVRVTVETVAVDSVVVATESGGAVAPFVVVDEATAVSAAD
jgi:hypothetical protein